MNYIGSKLSLIPFLEKSIIEFAKPTSDSTFFDIFAGTGIVCQHFKNLGYKIMANDIQYYSYCLIRAYIGINKQPKFSGIIGDLPKPHDLLMYDHIDIVLDYLNNLKGIEGFIFKNFCYGGTNENKFVRQYFTDKNGKLCDSIRIKLQEWFEKKLITPDEYFYLLASLIEAIDKVANTASVYGAFLKRIKQSAKKPLKLEKIKIVPNHKNHLVFNTDGKDLINKLEYDILYIDPPYNHRQYCTNYHVLETIAKYDEPKLSGVTGLREYHKQKSDFCYKSKALFALEQLIKNTRAKNVFLSYSSEGIMTENDITSVMQSYGKLELKKKEYRRFRADIEREKRRYRSDDLLEYLFCLRK